MKSHLAINRRDFFQSSAKVMAHSQIMMSVLGHASNKQALRLPVEGEIGSLDGAVVWLNSSPLSTPPTSRPGRSRLLLDIYLHQLVAHACSSLGEEVCALRFHSGRSSYSRILV